LADHVHGVADRIKNADGILLGGSYMDDVQKNLIPDPSSRYLWRSWMDQGSSVKLAYEWDGLGSLPPSLLTKQQVTWRY